MIGLRSVGPLRIALLFCLAACAPRPPLDAHIPPFARLPYEPFSRQAAVAIARREWRAFGSPVVVPGEALPGDEERAEGLWQRVGEYWWLGLDRRWPEQRWTGIHDAEGRVFPASEDGRYAWSAAFIDYVMRMAGATDHFLYAPDHAAYINAARRHGLGEDPGLAITALRLTAYAPMPGDLICAWRAGQPVTYDDLPTAHPFPAHCDIVVGREPGALEVIGGNVDNAVAMKRVPVAAGGYLAGPDGAVIDRDRPWFVVIRVDYQRNAPLPPPIASVTSRPRPPSIIASANRGSRSSARR